METRALANLLKRLATLQPSLTPNEEHEIESFIEELERNGSRSVTDLVKVIAKAWPPPKQPKRKTAPAAIDPAAFFKRLDAARNDPAEFEALLDELAKSKALKAADVAAIANRFRSSSKKYRTRAAAVDDVKKAWLEYRRDTDKIARIKEVF